MFTSAILQTLLMSTALNTALCSVVQLQKTFSERLLRGYDPGMRPSNLAKTDSPTNIKVNLFVSDIFDINSLKMEFSLQIFLRQTWQDPRLRYPDPDGHIKSIPLPLANKVWTPDLFFTEREGRFHNIQKSNQFIRIYPIGRVFFSSRMTLMIHCPMNFKYFPFDRQICSFDLESYGYTTKDVELIWSEVSPLQVNTNLQMLNFVLEDFTVDYCGEVSAGGYSCLKVKFLLKRQYGYYLAQIFIPFVITVAVSWLSLWLDPKATSIRLSLIAIIIYIMVAELGNIHTALPPTAYAKAIDIWITVCMAFVFATLLEFMLVNQLSRRETKTKLNPVNENCRNQNSISSRSLWQRNSGVIMPASKRIDFIFRILFPITFVLFNCIFWLTYVRGKDERIKWT